MKPKLNPTPAPAAEPAAEPPVETKDIRFGKRSRYAAGLKAVQESMGITLGEMGPLRGMGALLKLNQKDGYDCQSCAWPSPDEDRSAFEFCENGAKAVADEGMTQSATPEFFAKYSVAADLAAQSDHSGWASRAGSLVTPMVLRPGATHYVPIPWEDAFALLAAEAERARLPKRGHLLHLGPHEQRGSLPLPALRPGLRHQQPARLLEYVP